MVGKKLFFCLGLLLLSFSFLQAKKIAQAEEIDIRLLSMNGIEIEQVGIAKPFLIEVNIPDIPSRFNEPRITQFNAQRTSIYVNTINNKSTTKYTYKAVINKEGEYSLGPIVLGSGSSCLKSPEISVIVGEEEREIRKGNKQASELDSYFAVLSIGEEEVFVKEPVDTSFTIYYRNDLKVKSFELPTIPNVLVSNLEKPTVGTKKIDGTLYRYISWNWHLYPQVPGNFVIPAHSALVEVSTPRDPFNPFSFFRINNTETKNIYSDGKVVDVKPLLGAEQEVDGVGLFYDLSVSVEPTKVKEGEAFILKVQLFGDESLEVMPSFNLKNMNNTLKWYFSKTSLIDTEVDQVKKREWEFVVQALETGEIIIPAQNFYFFNMQTYSYETLYSDPVAIVVEKNIFLSSSSKKSSFEEETKEESTIKVNKDETLIIIDKDVLGKIQERNPFSFFLFFLLLILSLLVILRKNITKVIKNNPLWRSNFYRKKKLFRAIRCQVVKARK